MLVHPFKRPRDDLVRHAEGGAERVLLDVECLETLVERAIRLDDRIPHERRRGVAPRLEGLGEGHEALTQGARRCASHAVGVRRETRVEGRRGGPGPAGGRVRVVEAQPARRESIEVGRRVAPVAVAAHAVAPLRVHHDVDDVRRARVGDLPRPRPGPDDHRRPEPDAHRVRLRRLRPQLSPVGLEPDDLPSPEGHAPEAVLFDMAPDLTRGVELGARRDRAVGVGGLPGDLVVDEHPVDHVGPTRCALEERVVETRRGLQARALALAWNHELHGRRRRHDDRGLVPGVGALIARRREDPRRHGRAGALGHGGPDPGLGDEVEDDIAHGHAGGGVAGPQRETGGAYEADGGADGQGETAREGKPGEPVGQKGHGQGDPHGGGREPRGRSVRGLREADHEGTAGDERDEEREQERADLPRRHGVGEHEARDDAGDESLGEQIHPRGGSRLDADKRGGLVETDAERGLSLEPDPGDGQEPTHHEGDGEDSEEGVDLGVVGGVPLGKGSVGGHDGASVRPEGPWDAHRPPRHHGDT